VSGWFFLLYAAALAGYASIFADQKFFLFVLAAGAAVQGLAIWPRTSGWSPAARSLLAAVVVLLLTMLGASFGDVKTFVTTSTR